MIKLDTIQIASPCHADWDAMEGDDQVRFCGGCRKNVYNLSAMTCTEAEGLVNRLEGKLCVRFYTRPDGTALTQDCPVGRRAVRYRRLRKFSYAAAVVLSCVGGLLRGAGGVQGAPKAAVKPVPTQAVPTHTMGKPALPPARPPKVTTPKIAPPLHTPTRPGKSTMGLVAPPVLMGAPMAVKPEPPAKK